MLGTISNSQIFGAKPHLKKVVNVVHSHSFSSAGASLYQVPATHSNAVVEGNSGHQRLNLLHFALASDCFVRAAES